MHGPIRQITDGDEVVLSVGDAFHVHPDEPRQTAAPRRAEAVRPKASPGIEYLGFRNVEGRREYLLQVQRGEQARRYTVSIELAAFAARQALLQEGPDICYQKLARELAGADPQAAGSDPQAAGSVPQAPERIGVTDEDLVAYRATHAIVKRR